MSQTPIAGAEQLFAAARRRYDVVPIPEVGINVRIQSLTEQEKSDYETETLTRKGELSKHKLNSARRRLVALCVVDDAGRPLFAGGDVERLAAIDGLVTSRIYDACRRHCGFEEGDIEHLVKNSESAPVSGSPTD